MPNINTKIDKYFKTKIDELQEELNNINSPLFKIIVEAQIKTVQDMRNELHAIVQVNPRFVLIVPHEVRFGWYVGAVHPNGDDMSYYLHDDGEVRYGTSTTGSTSSGYFKTEQLAQDAYNKYYLL